ncbi:hypothetical protein D5S17_28235 [Pseudonocardiaceae bacterium YIM PH 21723]|nr:hypothetical protein D5S17_28235 [Pseudonocardiaceae bacterium YIM PH 21723]
MDSVADLTSAVLAGEFGATPDSVHVTSAFWMHHTTRLPGSTTTYRNHYLLLRVGRSFGACSFEEGTLDPDFCASASGVDLATLLGHRSAVVRIAALDAYLAEVRPMRGAPVFLPAGTPMERAVARDSGIADLLPDKPGSKVALIGVVNPLVAAITERGAECLPCDLNLRETQWGQKVTSDMHEVLEVADAVVATGMTLSNGSFDVILRRCRERGIPFIVYAQTGSAVARAFLGKGVTALFAEPFPFSQFSSQPTIAFQEIFAA